MMKITHKHTTTPAGETRVLTLPLWETFNSVGVIPELEVLFAEGYALVEHVAALPEPSFEDLVTGFEAHTERLSLLCGPVRHLNATMQKKYPELKGEKGLNTKVGDMLTNFGSDVSMHEGLYRAHIRFRDSDAYSTSTPAQRHLIDRLIKDFELDGVALPPDQKALLKTMRAKSTSLANAFGDNDTASTDAWEKRVADETVLFGIPKDDQARMHQAAKEKGFAGWLVTLQQPDVMAVLTHAAHRGLRREVLEAYAAVASELSVDVKWDNTPVMNDFLRNADATATMLGYPTYADMSLVKKMAGGVGVGGVRKFIGDLTLLARPKALVEIGTMKKFAESELGILTSDFMPWDMGYVREKMLKKLHGVNEEEVQKYFPFTKVMEGLTTLFNRLYGVTLVETEVSVWKEGVRFYEVYDESGVLRGAFYADMYAREGKRSGAWMDILVSSRKFPDGGTQVPVAYLNCNANMPSGGGDAYLKHGDVETLFHEAGHVFHHLLGLSSYIELSMEGVEWDTVELPSQFLENWCWEKDMLRLISAHKDDGKVIPDELIEKMIAAKFFNTGIDTLRQLCQGHFDFELYSRYDKTNPVDPNVLWREISLTVGVTPLNPRGRFPNSFSHIFGGGYEAGYFSYMWALGLAADAYRAFVESGDVFSRAVGLRFMNEVLAPGSSRPMAESFRAFRGRDLDPRALAIHLGLIES